MARGAIDLHEVAQSEILDPCGVEGEHPSASVPGVSGMRASGAATHRGNRFDATKSSATVFR
jgi:hypothetical protein